MKGEGEVRKGVPLMQIRYEGEVHEGEQGSGCWPIGGGKEPSLCWDTALPDPFEEIAVKRGERLTLFINAYEKPQSLSGTFFTAEDEKHVSDLALSPSETLSIPIDLPAGTYILSLFGQWEAGDVSYVFKISVEEGGGITTFPWEKSICGNSICEECEDSNSCCDYPCPAEGLCAPPMCLGHCPQDCEI